MSDTEKITTSWILSYRGIKNNVDPFKPYAWMVEKERTRSGTIEDTGIIFLTNRECPYSCLMCDLWKNTTDDTVPPGAIAAQIEWALEKMPGIRHLKLYNSGSFFDEKAIPVNEYKEIANLVNPLESVIVECHPKLIDEKCLKFRDLIKPKLQIALGLETVNREILQKLNKTMTPEDFKRSVNYLTKEGIGSRAFILLRTPYMSEEEGIYWAERSVDFAFDSGVECCTVIPVRGGNGAMEALAIDGHFTPPHLTTVEEVLEYGIKLRRGRVFADTWDLEIFSECNKCLNKRIERISQMNLVQEILGAVECECGKALH
ncbi:MAG TPA: radical SAM protein [Bacteroidales bacterium]|nr:radical SAM protein [Bacteroidales bacterium]